MQNEAKVKDKIKSGKKFRHGMTRAREGVREFEGGIARGKINRNGEKKGGTTQ